MPIIKSAIKKLRIDRKREAQNQPVRSKMKSLVKKARQSLTKESIGASYSALDRAVKKRIITKSKANRLKSRILAKAKKTSKQSPFAK